MSEDDAIIQAVAKDLMGTARILADRSRLSDEEEARDLAEDAIRAVYAALDKEGYAVAQKRPHDAITHNTFPKQGSFLGRRVLVAFDYDTANAVHGTVRREDVEAPGRMIIELDDGRLVLSTECQYSLVKGSDTRQ